MSGRERFKVHVLERFRLLAEHIPITIPPRLRKPQELLQALIAFGGTEVGAAVLIDALWPDSEGDAAYHALESAPYRLRQLLGARDAVRMAGGTVSLNRRRCRELLTRFLGVPPNAKTQSLYHSVRERAAYAPALRRSEHLPSEGT